MELMLTGRMIDAQEAVDMGLVNKVVPHEELGDAVLKTARAIAANGRNAVRLTKRAVRAGQDIDVQAGCEIEASIWALSFDEERTARMAAFLASGGSKYPIDLLKDAGVDMTTDEPLQLMMREMNRVMDEMDKLMAR